MTWLDQRIQFNLGTERYRIGRSLFIRGLALIYLIAIVSWWTQIELLVGTDGLLPASRFLEWLGERLAEADRSSFWALPNLFWITGASNVALHSTCFVACLLAGLVLWGRLIGPALAGLWFIYLSLVNTGGVFMSFQWDILLLEAGFLALFFCRWEWRTSWRDPGSLTLVNQVALVGYWLLIGKLMFLSGWVKLAWASEASPEWWPAGTAMTYHYMTQPIPPWTAWWMHQLPVWFHKASLVPMYLIELVLPFAIFFGRWGRLAAALGFSFLMGLIILTGNYTYFNWLTILLCLPLVQDGLWPKWIRKCFRETASSAPDSIPARRWWRHPGLGWSIAGIPLLSLFLLNGQVILSDFYQAPKPLLRVDLSPNWLNRFAQVLSPFHFVSSYGLFRTMTTERPEIIVEGSDDGTTWRAYNFAWKVDEIGERPRFVAPHQPRVAWQFWFAALGGRFDYRNPNAPWIEALVSKLLRGDKNVKALLKGDPFPEAPPRMIRARLMRYEFTNREERRATGNWWKRTVIGDYLPEVSLPREAESPGGAGKE